MKSLRFLTLIWSILLIVIFSNHSLFSQSFDDMKKARQFEQQANIDYKAKDFSGFLENIQKANDLRPNHPRILYNLADAFAINGKTNESLAVLERISKMGLYYPFEKDDDFKSLFELEKFKNIKQKTNLNKEPVNNSVQAFSIPDKNLITEGIAYNPQTKTFFISSVHQRKIITVNPKGEVKDFSTEADGLWSVSGMKVDAKRQILWACTNAFPQMRGFQKSDEGKSGIFKFDLKTGRLIKKYILSNTSEQHVLGDLTINNKGDVFATDSISPNIYFINSKVDTIEIYLKSDQFASLQGLAFTPDEKTLFVADYSKGVFKIDVKTKHLTQLKVANEVTVLSIDGLYFHQRNLIAIQNDINPNRVVKFFLSSDNAQIIKYSTLEANHINFNEPTLGVIVGNDFYYIANSQFSLVNNKGELNSEKLVSPVVLLLNLKK